MKITNVKPISTVLTVPDIGVDLTWTFINVETDEGITGVGEAGGGGHAISSMVNQVRESLVGENPFDTERLWNKTYRRYTFLGSRGIVTSVISGIDIALWDIKGKALGRPVCDLLGGRVRDSIPMYKGFGGGNTPEDAAKSAREEVAAGFTAIKFCPFDHERQHYKEGYVDGAISAEGEELAIAKVAAVRQAVGPTIELLIEAHGHFNVPTAIRIGNRLAEYNVGWYEEPVQPESYEALRQVRENVPVPICVGERLFTRYDFVPIFENRLADYIMPDVVNTGGFTEIRKIAAMAEAYYIPVTPHNAAGPIQIIAGAHAMIGVNNFYRLEFSSRLEIENSVLETPLDIRDGTLYLTDGPGLGIELDMDYLRAHSVPSREA